MFAYLVTQYLVLSSSLLDIKKKDIVEMIKRPRSIAVQPESGPPMFNSSPSIRPTYAKQL